MFVHTASDLSHIHNYVTKTPSIDIISLVFAINVDLFEQVFKICYCDQFSAENELECRYICTSFIESVKKCFPEQLKKLKVHLILHLVDDMKEFGQLHPLTQKGVYKNGYNLQLIPQKLGLFIYYCISGVKHSTHS